MGVQSRLSALMVIGLLGVRAMMAYGQAAPATPARASAATQGDATRAAPRAESHAALADALARRGWVEFPPPIIGVRHSGPSPAADAVPGATPPPVWFITRDITGNSRPHADPRQEQAFVRSIEEVHAGRTRVVDGGIIVLVDSAGRIWAVAEHMPHLLRCYDGNSWTYKRADGLPAAADEPAAFARRDPPRPHYAKDGLRDLNDSGRWYTTACADAAGNLHFFASCVSEDAVARGAGGGGVHTLRPDGTWTFFRIYPGEMPSHAMQLDGLRCVLHTRRGDAGGGDAAGGAAAGAADRPGDLVTIAEFRLSDPIAQAHGHRVEPIPPGSDALRRQMWKDRTDEPRHGPIYLLRFDGRTWRFERSVVGWGVYDAVHRSWPQPDGRVYLANRFGLWIQWPADPTDREVNRMIGRLLDAPGRELEAATWALASLGKRAIGLLTEAERQASAASSRQRLGRARELAEKAARGEEDAVPLVADRWRFFGAYPQATMPDGRFAFHCDRVVDVRSGGEQADALVFFDPVAGEFNVRPIDRPQWSTTDFADKRPLEPPVKNLDGSVVDLGAGFWVPGGYRCAPNGRIERLVPAGLKLHLPHFVDTEGRVYFRSDAPNRMSLYAYLPGDQGAPAPETTRPAAGRVAAKDVERQFENVRGLFRQPDLVPPWNAWAVQERAGRADVLLRLDGPDPTAVELPPGLQRVSALVPLDGGCLAAGPDAAALLIGANWDVAPDVRTLVERHGRRLAKVLPVRVFAADTSTFIGGTQSAEHRLLLASDGRGGVWLAEDRFGGPDPRGAHALAHFDGRAFTDLWPLMPLQPQRHEDGAVMTADRGRALIVQIEPNLDVRPGGYWSIWRVTPDDLRAGGERRVVPQAVNAPGFHPKLLAARGPNTLFASGLWADRQGWVWSPIFSESGAQWVRRHDARVGATPLSRSIWPDALVQGPDGRGGDGPVWCVTGRMRDDPMVLVDVSPVGEEPKAYPRPTWVARRVEGMGASARVAVAPDGSVYLLHEGGCSLLRLHRRAGGGGGGGDSGAAGATRPTRTAARAATTTTRAATTSIPARGPITRRGPVVIGPSEDWEIQEVARRAWDGPRNDFDRIAFDNTGVWFRPEHGPLIRAPLPRE